MPESYPAEPLWGVRWAERGFPPTCKQSNNEEEARSFYRFLLRRYEELGRNEKPELIRAAVVWEVVE